MAIIKINNNAIDLDAAEIPNLDASKITTGSLGTDRIPNLDASKITTGTITPSDGTVTTDKIVDANVTLAKLSATGTKDATTFLRGDNTFASAGGTNTPAFEVTLSANQSISQNTWTKLNLNSESFDSDNCYDNSTNYRFTPTTAGKYFCYGTFYLLGSGSTNFYLACRILKNGDTINGAIEPSMNIATNDVLTIQAHSIVTLNGSSDYVEFWVFQNEYSAGGAYNARGNSSGRQFCNFGAYKIIE
jgi:hypothetical protein